MVISLLTLQTTRHSEFVSEDGDEMLILANRVKCDSKKVGGNTVCPWLYFRFLNLGLEERGDLVIIPPPQNTKIP